jgi:hypothetical protein
MSTSMGGGSGQTVICGYPVHPVAEVYPLMTGPAFEDFCASVRKAMKVYEPVVFHEGQLIDGRNRLLAVEHIKRQTGKMPLWVREEWSANGAELLSDFVERRNGHRRQMTEDQRAASAVRMHGYREREESERRQKQSRFGSDGTDTGSGNDRSSMPVAVTPDLGSPKKLPAQCGRKRNPTTAERIAEKAGTKRHRVEKAIKVQKERGDAVLGKVVTGEITLNQALGEKKATASPRRFLSLLSVIGRP